MDDIARDLGVSRGTISKVLRNHPDIADHTRKRVLTRISELDYSPNMAARTLVTGRTYLVGLVVPTLQHPFFAEIAKHISDALKENGYFLIVSSSEEDPDLEGQEVAQLLARRLDALIIASCRSNVELFRQVEKRRTPYVLIDRSLPGLHANFVGVDDQAVGEIATRHLLDVGCKTIAHIRGPETSPGRGRLEGYKRALAQAGLTAHDDYISVQRRGDVGTREHGEQAMAQLLARRPRPDGVFCFNDPLAIGAMHRALDRGLGIPKELAIIGCGNLPYNDSLRVPLSSIDQCIPRLAQETARITFAILNSKVPPKPESITLQPALVVRASTQLFREKLRDETEKLLGEMTLQAGESICQ
jgi:LacI family transcriptional regulator